MTYCAWVKECSGDIWTILSALMTVSLSALVPPKEALFDLNFLFTAETDDVCRTPPPSALLSQGRAVLAF